MTYLYKNAVNYFNNIKKYSDLCPCGSGSLFKDCHGFIEDENEDEHKSFKSLKDLCEIKTNFPDADFWIIRKGSPSTVGRPTEEFNSEYIGIKVKKDMLHLLYPKYLFYSLLNLFNKNYFYPLLKGMTLVHVTVRDIQSIKISDLLNK